MNGVYGVYGVHVQGPVILGSNPVAAAVAQHRQLQSIFFNYVLLYTIAKPNCATHKDYLKKDIIDFNQTLPTHYHLSMPCLFFIELYLHHDIDISKIILKKRI